MRRFFILAGCLSALALAACGGDSSLPVATGKGTIRAINAIESAPEFAFLIEERGIGAVAFKQATAPANYDDLGYTFNFDVQFFGDTQRTRIASQQLDVVANRDYTFVIGGSLAAPTVTLWEDDRREWGETETATEFRFAHLAVSEDPVDVYLAAPGIDPVNGNEIGTLAYGEVLPSIEMPAGEFVVTVTGAGDDMDILFSSNSFTSAAATSVLITLFDGDDNDVSDYALLSYNTTSGGTAAFRDSRLNPTMRFIHASKTLGAVDIYTEDLETLPAPLISNHLFKDVTGDIPVDLQSMPLAYTTATDISMIHVQQTLTLNPGLRWDMLLFGGDGNPQILTSRIDRRSIETVVRMSFVQLAANHELTDIYVVNRDTDISDELVFPSFIGIPVNGAAIATQLLAGNYDLYLTTGGEKTVVAGPFQLDVALGDIVQLIAYDVDDTAFAEIVSIPLPSPAPPP